MSAKENDKLFGGSGKAVRGIENPRMESRHWWLVVVMEEERPWRCDDRGVDLGDSNLASGWRSGGGWGWRRVARMPEMMADGQEESGFKFGSRDVIGW